MTPYKSIDLINPIIDTDQVIVLKPPSPCISESECSTNSDYESDYSPYHSDDEYEYEHEQDDWD